MRFGTFLGLRGGLFEEETEHKQYTLLERPSCF